MRISTLGMSSLQVQQFLLRSITEVFCNLIGHVASPRTHLDTSWQFRTLATDIQYCIYNKNADCTSLHTVQGYIELMVAFWLVSIIFYCAVPGS